MFPRRGESAGNALQWLLTDGYGDATLEDDNGRTARDLVRVCASDPRVWPPPTTVCQVRASAGVMSALQLHA